eukprot:354077-Chlamydomonas_euryale.AAC.6
MHAPQDKAAGLTQRDALYVCKPAQGAVMLRGKQLPSSSKAAMLRRCRLSCGGCPALAREIC